MQRRDTQRSHWEAALLGKHKCSAILQCSLLIFFSSYFEGAIYRLKEFVDNYGEDGLNELNAISYAHVMTMDLDEAKQFSYCGADVHEGKLRILFGENYLGTNIDSALDRQILLKALNDAPAPEGSDVPLSFAARMDVRREYDPRAEEIRTQVAEILARPDIKLNPNFEDTYAKLLEESKTNKKTELRPDWQDVLGSFTRQYFEGLVSQLKWQKFDGDELLQEGLNEVVDKGEIAFRVVDKLSQGSYSEAVFEDGVLYLQVGDRVPPPHNVVTPRSFGINMENSARRRRGGQISATLRRNWWISCKLKF